MYIHINLSLSLNFILFLSYRLENIMPPPSLLSTFMCEKRLVERAVATGRYIAPRKLLKLKYEFCHDLWNTFVVCCICACTMLYV